MSARDVIALEASERTAVTLLDSSARTGSGSGDAIQFENLSRVYVRAAAKNRTTRHQGAASLTVTVEDSADGSSWSTVATFTFTDSETQAEAVDSPQAYLRVSWSVSSGTWTFGADAVLFASGAADTGGSHPSLLGPFSVDFDTPGFLNAENNGINTLAIPAGTLLLDVYPFTTEGFTGAVAHDTLVAAVLTDPSASGSGSGFALWQLEPRASLAPTIVWSSMYIVDAGVQGGSVESLDWGSQKIPALAIADCHIVLGAYTANPITAGSLDLYALVIAT